MIVQVRDLYRHFGKSKAVDGISFELSTGHVFGFVGPNGAGKTTTIRIMSTLDEPTSGDVLYDGVSVCEYPDEIRRVVGFMPDSLPGNRDIRVWEYIDFFARAYGLRGTKKRTVVAEIEEFTGLGELRGNFLNQLSKGQKQRVSLARALLNDPAVLILDEPAAGLDPRARLELRELLKLLSAQKKAIFLSSHILSELQDMCDGAVIIEHGKILSAGTFAEIAAAEERGGDPAVPRETVHSLQLGVLRDAETLLRFALEQPQVATGRQVGGNQILLEVRGGEAEAAELMIALFKSGIPIAHFRRQEFGLEDLFMRITKG